MNMTRIASWAISALMMVSSSAAIAETLDPIAQREKIVADANWKEMETVTITLDEHSYSPNKATFKAGKAYKLVLKNVGEKKHYFTAPEFYMAISTRKIEAPNQGEIKAPHVIALEIMPNGMLELFFVPVTKGSYTSYCTIEDHRKQGMEGVLQIE
ncbi:MAG: cupredoxin domain-containing protein [Magnetococcales bacterium]|nr:cupredoxin domain-containing protein [Magnetococcales bacterium]MBF0151647.1 cupredoxin domain-containing protein [Magnetococcales bacterium]MBF0174795.1 cupredoxin domain-containing protein [Magnetococcales bacterium]MBF0346060.1 cupredoxin domain-containing protein [Magnetococcales bacterium]